MVAREASIDVPRDQVVADHETRMLDSAVLGKKAGADPGDPGICVRVVDERLQPVLGGDGVVVEEDDERSSRDARARVAGCGETFGPLVFYGG